MNPSSSLSHRLALPAFAAALGLATQVFAAAPGSQNEVGYLPGTICGSGPLKDMACQKHIDCGENGKCVYPDFLGRPKVRGMLRIVVDDNATDWRDDVIAPHQTLTVILEGKVGKTKFALAETFESVGNAGNESAWVAWEDSATTRAFFPLPESGLLSPEQTCNVWLPRNRQPPLAIAEALIGLAGLAGQTVRPVVVRAKAAGPVAMLDHTMDAIASVVYCKVVIEFAPLGLLDP